jgi:hypothetical protein
MAADKSHLYAAAGLPVNTYVPSGVVNHHGSAMNLSGINNNVFNSSSDPNNQDSNYIYTTPNAFDYSMPSGDDRAAYEKAMDDVYANVVTNPGVNIFGIDVGKTTGYTGQGSQSRAGINAPSNTNTSPAGGGGGGSTGRAVAGTSIPQVVLNPQDLSQRTLSGSMYAPDLSAYNDSSLFNYTGPGGVNEYTYGQNLPYQGAGYDIWGSPADAPNPYYEGQFAPEPTPVGPADGAIGMGPVVMPPGIPPVSIQPPSSTNQPSMPGFTGGGGTGTGEKDLNYFETLAAMGIDPADAPSTTFPSPGETTIDPYKGEAALNKDVVKTTLDESYPYVPSDDGNFNYMEDTLMAGGSPNGRGGFDLYYDRDDVPKMTLDPNNLESNYLARDIAGGMAKNQAELMAKGQFLQDKYDAQEAIQIQDNIFNQHTDRNQAEYTPSLSDYFPDATPMQLAGSGSTLSGEQLNTRHPAYQAQLAREINEAENLFQNQDTGFPTETRGSFAGSSADLSATKDGPKTGPSGLTANDVKLNNLVEQMETGGSGYLNSLSGLPMRLLTGGDVTEKAINQHIINKSEDYGDGLAGYKDESSDGYKAVSGNPYHIRSGRDVGNLSGDKNLPLGGIPAALGGYAYQQLSEGAKDFGIEGLLQATDNARGLALSGNAPAVQSIFDFVDAASDNIAAGKARDTKIKKSIDDGTFKPGVKAPAKAAKEAEAAKSAKEKAAKAKSKAEAQAKAKAEQARSKAAAKAKSEAAAKAKAKKAADEAARNARENARRPTPAPKRVKVSYNRNKPTPVKKSKPTPRGPKPSKPTRTTGSRGGRGNVSRRRRTGGR